MEQQLLRVETVAKALSIGRSKAYELVSRGEIPSVTIGKCRRVPATSLARWIAERTTEAEAVAA